MLFYIFNLDLKLRRRKVKSNTNRSLLFSGQYFGD